MDLLLSMAKNVRKDMEELQTLFDEYSTHHGWSPGICVHCPSTGKLDCPFRIGDGCLISKTVDALNEFPDFLWEMDHPEELV